jgi:hypothetical protein
MAKAINPFTPRQVDERSAYINKELREKVNKAAQVRKYATSKYNAGETVVSEEDWKYIFDNYPYKEKLQDIKEWTSKKSQSMVWCKVSHELAYV